ncbi:MAG: hypothetical protein EXS48_02885 [Candidatus Staskawiczbacteria bacterium]|nr:hypothetical protein [Candidatus Staskawiczbacteria bacterium]
MFKKINKSKGSISTVFLIFGAVLFVVIVIVFVIITVNAKKNSTDQADVPVEPVGPVYEKQIGDVQFTFRSAQNIGSVLESSNTRYQPDLVTTERFIKVIIGAKNKGLLNVKKDTWDIGNIVDSEGRNFVAVGQDYRNSYLADSSNLCGVLLKPEFELINCVKYYEVSKKSTGLKVEIYTSTDARSKKKESGFLDLIVN